MKKILLLSIFLIAVTSCSNDDDLPQLPEIVVNEFSYGVDAAQSVTVQRAFNGQAQPLGNGVVNTELFITERSFNRTNTDNLEGNGFLISLALNGDSGLPLQPRVYDINSAIEIGSAQASYAEDFDTAQPANNQITIESGTITVRTYRTGYYIIIDAVDANGNEFHGRYLGESSLIL
jgi:hypothetical protein